jgi:hypothetical protein
MLLRVCRFLAIAAVALQLGGCIYSDYDISSSLKPMFPVKPGTYTKAGGPVIVVRRSGDAYQVYNRGTKLTTYARLFKIPEFPDYVMQYYDRKKKPIVYLFLKTTDKGFDVYNVEKLASVLPEHLAKLLAPGTDNNRSENEITVANGRRDTLYVVRELARANLKMNVAESYERRP